MELCADVIVQSDEGKEVQIARLKASENSFSILWHPLIDNNNDFDTSSVL